MENLDICPNCGETHKVWYKGEIGAKEELIRYVVCDKDQKDYDMNMES